MANLFSWIPAANASALADNELHVWRASLDLPSNIRQRLQSTLHSDEKGRVEKLLVEKAREHFAASRGILRELLSAYVGIDAERVSFHYGPEGKPSLSPEHNSKITFNVSHSNGMGLFVFANDQEVGVDIEYVKTDFRGMEIASRFFSAEEIAALTNLPVEKRDEAFFGCWTKKEAYVKAHGQGLGIPLDSFTVQLDKNKQVLRDEAGAPWSCYALEVGPGFAAAVVAAGENWNVKCLEWSGAERKTAPLVN